jgi:metallo-beta-lactamase family protein
MPVTLTFCGAARTVTGLCLLFEWGRQKVLVDCGMFQGPKTLKALNHEPFPFDPREVDAVLLTHAHIDHSGLLPRLVKQGFGGQIHATAATIELCACMLPDSGHIQESEVRMLNRRNRHRGRDEVEPIYTAADAEDALAAFTPVSYGQWVTPVAGLRARWWNAGHMLGSASIELEFEREMRVLVSGDIGPDISAMQPDPDGPLGSRTGGVDHLICESTYGDEDRPPVDEGARRAAITEIVQDAARRGGPLLIPTFAVERAQEVVMDLVALMREGAIPETTIYLDSPLAIRATKVFARHALATEAGHALRDALTSRRLEHVLEGEASRRLSRQEGFQIILAGSGMCEAGRIRHHLRARLWDPRATVALVGFQAEGTLGRLLHDGAKRVRIQGETIQVAARIGMVEGYSGHADQPELLRWIAARGPVKGGLFLVHGEPEAMEVMAGVIPGISPARIFRPVLDEGFRLSPHAIPERLPARPGRRLHPETVGRPDWHNERAALLLGIEEAIEKAPDEAERAALIGKLRAALG